MMSSETFDDFDSTDLALQLTEMAANRRQIGLVDSRQTPSSADSTIGIASNQSILEFQQQSMLRINDGRDKAMRSSPPTPHQQHQLRGLTINSPLQHSIDLSISRSVGSTIPIQNLSSSLMFSKDQQRLHHPMASVVAQSNSFSLEEFLSQQTLGVTGSNMPSTSNTLNIRNPSRTEYGGLPLSFLPSCSFNLASGANTEVADKASEAGKLPTHVRAGTTGSGLNCEEGIIAKNVSTANQCTTTAVAVTSYSTGLDFSSLFTTHDALRRTISERAAVSSPFPPAPEDKEAEALMQRMIDEGRMTTKRHRSPRRPRSTNRLSGTSATNMAGMLAAAAAGNCGLNLSLTGSDGAGVRVKEEQSVGGDLSKGSELVTVSSTSASRQFDSLYLAYTAAMQAAAAVSGAGGVSSATGTTDLIDIKPSQNFLLGARFGGDGAGAGISSVGLRHFDPASVDAQAAQAARLAMLHLQMPQPSVTPSTPGSGEVATSGRRYSLNSKAFHCLACSKGLSSMHNLKLHEATVHRGLFQYRCPLCGKGLRQERDLRGHLANRHNMKKDFRCSVCGNEFGYKRNLKQHMVSYHGWKEQLLQMSS